MKYKGFLAKIFLAASLIGAPSMALADDIRLSADTEMVIQSEKTELAKAEVIDPLLTAGEVLKMPDEQFKNYILTQLSVIMSNLRSPTDLKGSPKPPEVMARHQQHYADLWNAFYNPDKPEEDGNSFAGLLAEFLEADPETRAIDVFKSYIKLVFDLYDQRRALASNAPQPNSP